MLPGQAEHIINTWINGLAYYSFVQLCTKPPGSWSPGQLYMHLITDTDFYIQQAKACLNSIDHFAEEALPVAKRMFFNDDFPDEIIEGAPSNAYIPQPESKEQLMKDLLNLKEEMNRVGLLISQTTVKGKTKHPGLGYFSAEEWMQFAGMHFRHHLQQKKRIDAFLKTMDN